MDIAPNTAVTVEIVKRPASVAARKTLDRVCRKDPTVAKAIRKRKERRPSWQTWQRGGRMWHHQMKSHSGIRLEPGASYQLTATLDVLRDLASVERFIAVKPQ